jgi:hypothetical protein
METIRQGLVLVGQTCIEGGKCEGQEGQIRKRGRIARICLGACNHGSLNYAYIAAWVTRDEGQGNVNIGSQLGE